MHFSTPIVFAAAAQVASAAQGSVVVSTSDFNVQTIGFTGAKGKVDPAFWDTISKTANASLSVPVDGYSVTSAFKDQKLDGWKLNLYVQDNIPAGGSDVIAGAAIQLVSPDSQKTDAMGDWDICAFVYRTPNSKGAATDKGSCSKLATDDCVKKRLDAFLADPKCGSFADTSDISDSCLPSTKDTVGTYQRKPLLPLPYLKSKRH